MVKRNIWPLPRQQKWKLFKCRRPRTEKRVQCYQVRRGTLRFVLLSARGLTKVSMQVPATYMGASSYSRSWGLECLGREVSVISNAIPGTVVVLTKNQSCSCHNKGGFVTYVWRGNELATPILGKNDDCPREWRHWWCCLVQDGR